MKLPPLKRVSIEDYKDAPSWFGKFVILANSFFQNAYSALNRGLTLQDNIRCEIVDIETTSAITGREIATKIAPVTGVLLLGVTGASFTASPAFRWRSQEGKVIIDEFTGLVAGVKYKIRFLVL